MQINIYTLTSSIHDAAAIEASTRNYIEQLTVAMHRINPQAGLLLQGNDFSTFGTATLDLIFVRTGGTEGVFKQLEQDNRQVRTTGKLHLLTLGESNSLAASMEILSYLNQTGRKGEIMHGSIAYVARQIDRQLRIAIARQQLQGQRIGVVGEPSDWLIASQVDEQALYSRLGICLQHISMEEFLQEIARHHYPAEVKQRLLPTSHYPMEGALEIYGALHRLVNKYRLNALTVRCFDLLTTVHNTGCIALALLNSEGIPSSCEGDIPALLTMMIGNALTGISGFQANPSRINPETGEIVFAHCTIPLNMLTGYTYNTHFESGIGVAIKGEVPTGDVTLMKFSGDLKRLFVQDVQLLTNLCEQQLCRTQVVLHAPNAINYFFHSPIGNHHILLPGHHTQLINTFWEEI